MVPCYRGSSFSLGSIINSLYENPILMLAFIATIAGSVWFIFNRKKSDVNSEFEPQAEADNNL